MTESPEITGPQRVAAFLLSLDKEAAAGLMRRLDPRVIPDVAQAMTELDPELCTPDAVASLFGDLARGVFEPSKVRARDHRELAEILESSFGEERAQEVLRDIEVRRRKHKPFAFIEARPASASYRMLAAESPAVVALVLAHVSPAVSAEILSGFEPEAALEIVKRMTTISPPDVETMLRIADDLERRLDELGSSPLPRDRAAGLKTIADLLNFSDSEIEKAVLDGLEEEGEVADEIREFMFTWADLAEVDKRAMQKILAAVDTRTLSMALKACSPAVEDNVMGNLSSRVKEMVRDERELLGAVPFAEVLEARAEIMKSVRSLMESGEFSPARGGEELVT